MTLTKNKVIKMSAKVIRLGSQKNVRRYNNDITNSEPYIFWMTFIVTHLPFNSILALVKKVFYRFLYVFMVFLTNRKFTLISPTPELW